MQPAAPWTARYEPGVPESLAPTDAPFHAALDGAAAAAPDYVATVFYAQRLKYAELHALADRVAGALLRDGLRPAEQVLVALPGGPHLAAAVHGILKAGGVVRPLPAGTALPPSAAGLGARAAIATPDRAADVAPGLGPHGRLVLVRPERALPLGVRLIRGLLGAAPAPIHVPRPPDAVDWPAWLTAGAPAGRPTVPPDAPALVVPGADGSGEERFDHRHLVAGAEGLKAWLPDALPGEDTWLLLADPLSAFGLVVGLGTVVALRARLVVVPAWTAQDVVDALRYLRPAFVASTADDLARLAADPTLSRADFHGVRAWLTSDPIDAATARAFEEFAGFGPCAGYAPPGAAGLVTCNPINGRRAAGSIGLPLPGVEMRLAIRDGVPEAARPVGWLELRGPSIVSAEPEGWLSTGRLARVDAAGFVYLVSAGPRLLAGRPARRNVARGSAFS